MLGRVRDILRASVLSFVALGCSRSQPAASAPPAPMIALTKEPEPEAPPPPAMPPKLDPMSTWKPGATVTVYFRLPLTTPTLTVSSKLASLQYLSIASRT